MMLRTARLVLRDFDPGDVPAVLAYQSDPRYLRQTTWTSRTETDVRNFVEMMMRWAAEEPRTRFQLAITREGVLIGNCGVRKLSAESREAEYGCELAPSAWGRGYAEEASRALLGIGFESLDISRVVAHTTKHNAAALALALRLGFHEEAYRRGHDQSREPSPEMVMLSLHADAWKTTT